MEADFIAQIRSKFGTQACQAFDPMMLLEEKISGMGLTELSTSCKAPAYVYLEGMHGKKFLCDFHYKFEISASPYDHVRIKEVFVDGLDLITETFADPPEGQSVPPEIDCWCGAKAYVFDQDFDRIKLCNFHFRKTYYRAVSNGIEPYNNMSILDYRKLMPMTIQEEIKLLPIT